MFRSLFMPIHCIQVPKSICGLASMTELLMFVKGGDDTMRGMLKHIDVRTVLASHFYNYN